MRRPPPPQNRPQRPLPPPKPPHRLARINVDGVTVVEATVVEATVVEAATAVDRAGRVKRMTG